MALSWNEIKERAVNFSKEWEKDFNERAEAKSFMDAFFNVFGVNRRRVATFESNVKSEIGKQGFIDLLWKGKILIEFKSKGKDLDKAHDQAIGYFSGLKDNELPRYILVSDFANFRLYDLEENTQIEFQLKDLVNNVQAFGFIAGYEQKTYEDQDHVNIKAAELMGKLHDRLKEIGYEGHPLEVYLVRVLFCLFAEDTTIFEKQLFQDYIQQRTSEDGSDLAGKLQEIFQVLNTPKEKRFKNLDEQLNKFPYVNGKLFEEVLPIASFDSKMRHALLECCYLDWSLISPAIFGSMFQAVMNKEERRNLGAHYTSEKNILKLIEPLFLDELYDEFESVKGNRNKLIDFHKKIAKLKFLDPACGCGNFLVITYRELRILEMEILKVLSKKEMFTNIKNVALLDVDQMYGIEIEEFPARIAEVAMWLVDHQMNQKLSEEFGIYFLRLPLQKAANILNANALHTDWNSLIKPRIIETYFYDMGKKEVAGKVEEVKDDYAYILGNPPFIGYSFQSKRQKEDMEFVFSRYEDAGVLDYVACWYLKAAKVIQDAQTQVAFVSTNSISQGEQVGVLWKILLHEFNVKINFAHRTFDWSNEAKNNAAVHVVIIGFSQKENQNKFIYDYEDIKGDPHKTEAKNINPYLLDGPNILIVKRNKPINQVPMMSKGSSPTDGKNLLLDDSVKEETLVKYPELTPYIKRYMGTDEFIYDIKRWCLWLKDADPSIIRSNPFIQERLKAVKTFRLKSPKIPTQKWAEFPSLFIEERQPDSDYIFIPRVSSENRKYIPIGYVSKDIIISDSAISLVGAKLFQYGILLSIMHMTWVKYVCGRLKSDYRYSNTIVYNNFPWPLDLKEKQIQKIETATQLILTVRQEFQDKAFSILYDPTAMPPKLVKAHQELDKAVDAAYRSKPFESEAKRMEFLFELYEKYTADLFTKKKGKGK
ncbi:MAG: class I SAM-dependent DNA methyltransferase [Leptospiraceae bacterium]|nr:class I SAM-dependent DNA methyltransferase [Leptospiraceae bacterium]